MALTTAYMASVKNVPGILESLKDAGVPQRFTNEFLKSTGFTSSNDRAILNVLKGLAFLDQAGVPTERYRNFRDRTKSKHVLAEAIRDGYGDLFLANEKAHLMSAEKVKGFFATKTDKGDRVVEQMMYTFRALAALADFSEPAPPPAVAPAPEPVRREDGAGGEAETGEVRRRAGRLDAEFHYNIQIHLPPTRDIAVYNAIFRALRDNLT